MSDVLWQQVTPMDPTGEGLPPVGGKRSIFFPSGWGSQPRWCVHVKSSYRVVLNYTEFDNDLNNKCVSQVSVLMEVEGQVLMAVMGCSGHLNVVLWSLICIHFCSDLNFFFSCNYSYS